MLDITVFVVAFIAVSIVESIIATTVVIGIFKSKKMLIKYSKLYADTANEMLEN